MEILVFWSTEISHAQSKEKGENARLLGIETCPSLNEIRIRIRIRIRKLYFDSAHNKTVQHKL